MTSNHQQPEAFHLMTYECEECCFKEQIWNSRNAVTPFMVGCSQQGCTGLMKHVEWRKDRRSLVLPQAASRVFVSMTMDVAHHHAREQYERFEGHPTMPPPEPKEETIESWAKGLYRDGEQPHVISRVEYLKQQQSQEAS